MLQLRYQDQDREVPRGTRFYEVVKETKGSLRPILARQEGEYFELDDYIKEEGEVIPVYIDDINGNKAYERTLSFILVVALDNVFPGLTLSIDHSISRGLFCHIEERRLSSEELLLVKAEMVRIIAGNHPIGKTYMSLDEAFKVFIKRRMCDRVDLLKDSGLQRIKLYELLGHYDYFYGKMAVSTGAIDLYDLVEYQAGFIITYPTIAEPEVLPKFQPQDMLYGIFRETQEWDNIIGVETVGFLNEKISSNESFDLVRVTEALHEKKIAYIADDIAKRKDVRIVMIAGPSSSGKTTFARRLGIQLRVNGLVPIPIGMDDYFVNRRLTPKNADGSFDFESLEAIDIDLFQDHIGRILKGEEVTLPKFDFKTGLRGTSEHKVKLPKNGVIIIEGIHGLNPALLEDIPAASKFKVYISALTALNLDYHNRIATTDVRKLRRMVRDILSRGYSAIDTLSIFPSVTRGEKIHIFPHQDQADAMFNSTLLYELAVLKKHCLKELKRIPRSSMIYEEAKRLNTILSLFKDIPDDMVPENSILREFIGGSCFYEY